jgi:hypothetical protein
MKIEVKNKKMVEIIHLLDLIERTNKQIKMAEDHNDSFDVMQYQRLKKQFVGELDVLLRKYDLKLQTQDTELKEAA